LIVTVAPTGPDVGENEVMVGAEVEPSAWTDPMVTLWPKKHPLVQVSDPVMLTSLLRSTLPLSVRSGELEKPHSLDPGFPRASAPSVGSPSPVSTVCPIRPNAQSVTVIDSSPFESTFPPMVDQAKSAANTPGLVGSVAL
jgi:hypothetical protein